MTKEKTTEFQELAKPLIKWLNNNANPHAVVIIECDSARFLYGEHGFPTDEFILD